MSYLMNTGEIQQTIQMTAVAVNTARRYQTHQMQRFILLHTVIHYLLKSFVILQSVLTHGFIDSGQFLVHNSAGAHICVAYFAVAHLAIRQANG